LDNALPQSPPTIPANLKALHMELEELFLRVKITDHKRDLAVEIRRPEIVIRGK
jgi:hypothetical protein